MICKICQTNYTNEADLLLIEDTGRCSSCGKIEADLEWDEKLMTPDEIDFYTT